MHRSWYVLMCAVLAAGCDSDEPMATAPLSHHARADNLPRYHVAILGSLGPGVSRGTAISNGGLVAGFSTALNGTRQAVLYSDSVPNTLGTLGGPSSSVVWPGLSANSLVVGISHRVETDSLGEAWSCEFGGFLPATNPRRVCRGFAWENGAMVAMPTLGGTHSFATGVNASGAVVGWAETAVFDPTCTGDQKLQFRAVQWNPRSGALRELRPYPGDSTSAATAINARGQAVGISGECSVAVGGFSARRAVMWDGDEVIKLPDLGGTTWHTPMAINAYGDVVGFSNPPLPGDSQAVFLAQAFLVRRGATAAIPLGTLGADPNSQALSINIHGQVVGLSSGGAAGVRAFLWQDTLVNLNDLMEPGFPHVLQSAQDINDAGVITGRLRHGTTGQILAFVATPIR